MATATDERVARRSTRPDPRVDPDPGPPALAEQDHLERSGLRDVVAPRSTRPDPRVDPASIPGMRAVTEPAASELVEAPIDQVATPEAPAAGEATIERAREEARAPRGAEGDPRLAEIEALVDRSAWKDIADKLDPGAKAGDLPPALALLHALARRETAGDEAAPRATEVAIRSMAALLGVAPESPAALVLAKRLLRKNPASWRSRPAPSARLSVALVVLAIVVGVAAGSFLSLEAFRSFELF